MARNEDRQAEWRARLARWLHSGLSIRRFCLRESVSEPSFYQWRKRLRVADAAERQVSSPRAGSSPNATFLPIEVIGGGSAVDATCIEIHLPSGVTVRVPEGVAEARLHALVRLLRGDDARC